MLPFLIKKEASTADSKKEKLGQNKPEQTSSLESAMKTLFSAQTNAERAAAFKEAFLILESKPHKEASHG